MDSCKPSQSLDAPEILPDTDAPLYLSVCCYCWPSMSHLCLQRGLRAWCSATGRPQSQSSQLQAA